MAEDAIQKIVESVVLPKHVQIAHGKTVVTPGVTYTNGSKIRPYQLLYFF